MKTTLLLLLAAILSGCATTDAKPNLRKPPVEYSAR